LRQSIYKNRARKIPETVNSLNKNQRFASAGASDFQIDGSPGKAILSFGVGDVALQRHKSGGWIAGKTSVISGDEAIQEESFLILALCLLIKKRLPMNSCLPICGIRL
jgi:hypothetical protein